MAKARKEVDKRRRHFNMSKSGFVSQIGSDPAKTNQRDVLIDESKQATSRTLASAFGSRRRPDARRFLAHGGAIQHDLQTINQEMASSLASLRTRWCAVYRDVQPAQCVLCNVPATTPEPSQDVPSQFQLRRPLVSLHHPPGEKTNRTFVPSTLRYWKRTTPRRTTSTSTTGGSAHAHPRHDRFRQKFSVQFSSHQRTEISAADLHLRHRRLVSVAYGDLRRDVFERWPGEPDFTINPFSLPESKENLQFLFSFFRVLIEVTTSVTGSTSKRSGSCGSDRADVRYCAGAADAIHLQPDHRGVEGAVAPLDQGGQYGFLFDNVEDTLSFSKFQTFNFAGWGDAPEVLEPLLFYVSTGPATRSRIPRIWRPSRHSC